MKKEFNETLSLDELFARVKQDPEPVSRSDFEQRCYREMGELLAEADRHDFKPTFVGVATWHLAAIVRACGHRATADILRQLAGHVAHIVECEQAAAEAAQAQADGRRSH